jgi:excisionase family DNA binding protein
MTEPIPQLLTLAAVAKALCVSPHTVRSWIRKGRLRPIRLCRRLLFHPSEIARFLTEAK